MTDARLDALRASLNDFGDRTLSVYTPRPIIEVGGEKWRILRKNLVSQLEERFTDGEAGALVERLEAVELPDFRGAGLAFFATGDKVKAAHLSRRPYAMVSDGAEPLVAPLLADASDEKSRWVLALDRTEPKLYFYAGGTIEEKKGAFDAPDYRSIEAQRYVHDDVFFHSGGKVKSDGGKGPSVFHALGSDQSQEREKTDENYYRRVGEALEDAVPAQVRRIDVFGDPHTAGAFCKLMEPSRLECLQHNAAGESLEPERIAEAIAAEKELITDLPDGERDLKALADAAREGRIETLYVCIERAGLEEDPAQENEHLRLRGPEELKPVIAVNAVVAAAFLNGAEICWTPPGLPDTPDGLLGVLRW